MTADVIAGIPLQAARTLAAWRLPRLAALALALLAGPACAGSISMHHAFPDAPAITKKVASLQRLRNANVVFQGQDYSCGAAALATLLRFGYGMDHNEESVIRGMLEVSDKEVVARDGFSLLDMKRYAEQQGLRARGFRASVEDLRNLRVPVIALLDMDGYAHFVLVRGIDKGLVRLLDPMAGARSVPLHRFKESWNGVVLAVIGEGYRFQGLLARDDAWQGLQPPQVHQPVHFQPELEMRSMRQF